MEGRSKEKDWRRADLRVKSEFDILTMNVVDYNYNP